MVKFLDLQKQYLSIKEEIDQAIDEVIAASAFIGGPYVQKFEKEFATYLGVEYCTGCGNGTDALEIIFSALDMPPGSEVLVPANSFIASAEAVTRSGHKIVFVDCTGDDYTIDLRDAERKVGPLTRTIMPVHLYGHPADMEGVTALARKHSLFVVEDCAQAHGAEVAGKKVGGFGDLAAFSFYPGKNLGAYGDAGAICGNNPQLAERCRMIANHGRLKKYDHLFEGRNSRLDGLQAAILSVKLRYLEDWLDARRQAAEYYYRELAGLDQLVLPLEKNKARHVYHLFVVRSAQRDLLRERLTAAGIGCGIHYPVALPELQAFRYLEQQGNAPRASRFAGELLSLPMGEHLSEGELDEVVSAVHKAFL